MKRDPKPLRNTRQKPLARRCRRTRMQHGMHNSIELMRVESQLLDRELKYHYLIADERLRNPRSTFLPNLIASFRALVAPRPMLTQERGV
jgi:hypothetical protein